MQPSRRSEPPGRPWQASGHHMPGAGRAVTACDQAPSGQACQATDVPVVEPDDEKTAPGQAFAQLVRPGDHLRRQAHDQHGRRRARVTERLVRQLDTVRGDPAQRAGSDIFHGRSLACDKPSITSAVRQQLGKAPGGNADRGSRRRG